MSATRLLFWLATATLVACAPATSEPPDGGTDECPAGQSLCGDTCTPTQSDPANCGGCEKACSGTDSCVSGQCLHIDCRQAGVTCATGTYCSLNDGRCLPGCALNSQCPANSACDLGTHSCVCDTGKHKCGGACVSEDALSCGPSCTVCDVPAGGAASCVQHVCSQGCVAGQSHLCGQACLANNSIDHCGASSCSPCTPPAHATSTCDGTACDFTCDPGFTKCGGACIDTTSDSNNCGACNKTCNFGEACSRSKCRATCLGTPGFTTAAAIPAAANLWPVAIDDFSGTGNGDLALLSTNQVLIAQGRGDGGFNSATSRGSFSGSPGSSDLASSDVDGTGRPDVLGIVSYVVTPLLEQADGGMTAGQGAQVGAVFHFATGDLNNDGYNDVVTIDDGRDGIGIAMGSATGFGTPTSISINSLVVSREPVAISLCDFNHDGKLDAVYSDTYTPTFIGDPKGEVYVLSNGDHGLANPVKVFTGSSTKAGKLVAGNFSAAGSCDIAYDDNGTLKLLVNNGNAGFTVSSGSPIFTGTVDDLMRVPFHGKTGIDDLLVRSGSAVTLYHGGFPMLTTSAGLNVGSTTLPRACGLLNGDLIPDLVVANSTGGVSLMTGTCQ